MPTTTSSTNITATATWFPQLEGAPVPQALKDGMKQAYLLLYSLRDALSNLQQQQQSGAPGGAIAYGKLYQPLFTAAPIPNCQIVTPGPGDWLITAVIAANINSGDEASHLIFSMFFNNSVVHPSLQLQGFAPSELVATGQWIVTDNAGGGTALMEAQSDHLGNGSSMVTTNGTSISCAWLGQPGTSSIGEFQ